MRARYYSPDMRRFVNADIVAGEISNAVTLNRFAYANGNPVSFVDPFGLTADIRDDSTSLKVMKGTDQIIETVGSSITYMDAGRTIVNSIQSINDPLKLSGDFLGDASKMAKSLEVGGYIADAAGVFIDVGVGVAENVQNDTAIEYIISDAIVDFRFAATGMAIGIAVGSVIPVAGNAVGAVVGVVIGSAVGLLYDYLSEEKEWGLLGGKTAKEAAKDCARKVADFLKFW